MEETLARYDDLEKQAPIVIVTGHPLDRVKKLLREPERVEMVHKPFEENILVAAIARALNRKQEESTSRITKILNEMREMLGPPQDEPSPLASQ